MCIRDRLPRKTHAQQHAVEQGQHASWHAGHRRAHVGVKVGAHFCRGRLRGHADGRIDLRHMGDDFILGVVVALDVDAFEQRTANAWASWKENTPFTPMHGYRLEAQIAAPQDDHRQGALQYLLLHEFGHVLAAGRGLLPEWWNDTQAMRETDDYLYLPLAWRITPGKEVVPLPENDFQLRGDIAYYQAPRLAASQMPDAYAQLRSANFATLYAATSMHEDFAESFASYVHTIMLGKPQCIRIHRDGKLLLQFDNYWDDQRSARKRQCLEQLLGK